MNPAQISPLSNLDIAVEEHALFFDFDGVIADIAPRPDAVEVPEFRAGVLADWRTEAGGALALVSGREAADIRKVFPAYEGAISGGHGAEIEWPDGSREQQDVDHETVARVADAMRAFADEHEGLLFEPKRLGGVLHYRADPSLEGAVRERVGQLVEDEPALEIQLAKMAVEVKPAGFSKGSVIGRFMERPPFAGRVPLYAGDDVTDEAAFAVINDLGGISIKVGDEPTCAHYNTGSPSDLFDWMGLQTHSVRSSRL